MQIFYRLALCVAVLSAVTPLEAELATLGDINVAIDPLGYGIPGQPGALVDVIIGVTDYGQLLGDVAFDPGPLLSNTGVLGDEENSIGMASFDGYVSGGVANLGVRSEWLIQETLVIGNAGYATLDLFDKSRLQVGSNAYDFDEVPTSVPPSSIIRVADPGQNDGLGLTIIGALETGDGELSLTNQGTVFLSRELIVGDLGRGVMNASAGALIYTGEAFIGNQESARGVVTISDPRTRWNIGDSVTRSNLTIGNADDEENLATGTLRITNGALVQATDEIIINRRGVLELESGGRLAIPTSLFNSPRIVNNGIVSGSGTIDFAEREFINGDINLAPTTGYIGEIRNKGNAIIGGIATNQPEKLVFDGELLTNNSLIESDGGMMEFYSFVDNTIDGAIISTDAIMKFYGGLLNDGEFALGGASKIYGDIVSSNNFFIMADSTSIIYGSVVMNPGALASFTLGSDLGTLDVIGNVDITGGLLDLSYSAGGFNAQVGDSYDIIRASEGIIGDFDNLQASAAGLLWDIDNTGTTIRVTAIGAAAIPVGADFNGDGIVNGADLLIWQDNYGRTSPPDLSAFGDADGDGDVDGRDFLRIQQRWGMPGALTGGMVSVPEPSTMVLLLSLAIGGIGLKRR